jgi:hypothetical protein
MLKPGQGVVLKANPDEGWEREEATVVQVVQMPWGPSIVVEVEHDPDYPFDDGLREVTEDQIEAIL